MTSPSEPIGRLENGLTWPFRLASLNKERQGRPARRTGLESEKASAGAFTIYIICDVQWGLEKFEKLFGTMASSAQRQFNNRKTENRRS